MDNFDTGSKSYIGDFLLKTSGHPAGGKSCAVVV